jgi:CRISPR-associated protein Cmr6
MRFGMYLKLWGTDERSGKRLWSTNDVIYRRRGPQQVERELPHENKAEALMEATRLTMADRQLMSALLARQTALAEVLQASGQLLRVDADAIAPFMTGLGNEHPLENGFAFLNPYGLPYLPGSGVKGVVRQAARELASGEWGDQQGWDQDARFLLELDKTRIPMTMLDVLFGKQSGDGESEHVRGALQFWDVFPQVQGVSLAVEVMTAHQSHYLQGSDSPHESGQPNPINFLTAPPGSGFHFHIQCDQPFLAHLSPELAEPNVWQGLISAALKHAFDWLGFGAKTAVGYGAMRRDRSAEQERLQAQRAAEEQRRCDEVERRRREEAEAKAAQQQAAFDSLPEGEKALRRFKEGLAGLAGDGLLNKDQYPEFSRLVNELAEQAQSWPDKTERQRAADMMKAALDGFGWTAPGIKADKRKKQDSKRRKQLDSVVEGRL